MTNEGERNDRFETCGHGSLDRYAKADGRVGTW